MSPELIAPERFGFKNGRPTKHSDCYALGMVVYEIISGNLPFHKDTNPAVFMKVVEGKHPPRGMRFTDSLWEMLELCWAAQPLNRPTAQHVLQRLEMVSNLPQPTSGMDEEIEEEGDDWDSTTESSSVPNWLTERNSATSPGFDDRLSTGPVWATPESPTGGTYLVGIPTAASIHSPTELNSTTSTSNVMRVMAYQLNVIQVFQADRVLRGRSPRLVPAPRNSFEQGIFPVSNPSISNVSSLPSPRIPPDSQIPLSFLGEETLQVQFSEGDATDLDMRSCVSEQEPADYMLTLRYQPLVGSASAGQAWGPVQP